MEKTDILPPTRVLAGKYRLGRLLGEGGMGTVYEAEHTGLGSRVAVKILTERFTGDADALARFRREARASAAVQHENVVRVTDTGTDEEGTPFLVMELLEGESLNAVLKRNRRLEPEAAVAIVSEVLEGLAAAHDKGVVHRDLKPANVFLTREADGAQKAKILDFGISKYGGDVTAREITIEGAVVGTPQYMPPEQVSGERNLDARADLYAVGVLLYRMTTGRLPFTADNPSTLYQHILAGNPVAPHQIAPDMPQELEAVILTAMAPDRHDRYPDARTFRQALLRALPTAPGRIPTLTPPPLVPFAEELDHSSAATVPARRRRSLPAEAGEPRSPQRSSSEPLSGSRRHGRWIGTGIAVAAAGVLAAIWAVWGVTGQWGFAGEPAETGAQGPEAVHADKVPDGTEPATGEVAPLHFGVAAYNPHEMVAEDHQPFVDYLSTTLERPVTLEIVDAYLDLEGKLIDARVQLAALAPAAYVRAKARAPGIKLLATPVRHGGPSYRGYILTRADSGIDTLQELRGKKFCYVNRRSTSGYLYPRALFRQEGIEPDADFFGQTTFAGHHLASLSMLHDGSCDGAAVYANMLHDEARKHGMAPEAFHVLAGTARIPYDAYCVPADQPPEVTEAVRSALLALEPGSALSKRVFDPRGDVTGFAPANDSDYDPVRSIAQFLEE